VKNVIDINANDTQTVRRWLTQHIERARAEIARAQERIAIFEKLMRELPAGKTKAGVPVPVSSYRLGKDDINSPRFVETLKILDAAGRRGVTAQELSKAVGIPTGSASSRLSVLKTYGKIGHVSPRYFAQHSTPEDNNRDIQD